MTHLRVLFLKLAGLFRRDRFEQQLDEDVRAHLEMLIDENLGKGMNPEEARYAALRQFGNVSSMKEECRERWSTCIIEELVQDVRYGLRQLRRNPGFTAVVVLTLALGIGATTAIFSVIYCGFLNPWPYKDSGRLAVLVTHDPNEPRFDSWAWVSPAEFMDYKEQNHVFDQVIGGLPKDMVLTGRNIPPGWFNAIRLTANTFKVLGMSPILGRTFSAEDSKAGAPPVVLLSYKEWQSKFGGNPGIIGQTIMLDRQPTTVIGVMAPRFKWYGGGPDGWLPAVSFRSKVSGPEETTPVVGHLKPGVTVAQASADLAVIAMRLARAYPKSHSKGIVYSVKSLTESCVDNESRRTLSILMAGVALLLLIACVNVANLLLSRSAARRHEVAVRAALGASRGRLLRQFLLESLLLATGGSALGYLLAWGVLNVLVGIIPPWYIMSESDIRLSTSTLLFTACVALLSTLLFGLAPALHAIGKDLQQPLNASGRVAGDSRGHNRLRNLLVVSEVTLSLVLLTGAGLLFHSFWTLRHVKLGYNVSHVLRAGAALSQEYKTASQRNQFQLEVLRRVRSLPGVVSATLGWPTMNWAGSAHVELPGQSGAENKAVWFRLVGDRFFTTLSIPLLEGRTISEEDLLSARRVVTVNRAFVQKFFNGEKPLGRQIKVTFPQWFPPIENTPFEIVGVVADTEHGPGAEPAVEPQVFLPTTVAGIPWNMVFIRTAGNPAGLTNAVRKQFEAMDKGLPIDVAPVRDDFSGWYTEPRFVMGIVVGLALLGMLLVCFGVYSVLSYAVSQRTNEIGVRMALGAQVADVRNMVVMGGLRWLAIGIGVGVAASIALEKILQNRIWGIKSADPLTLVAVSLVLTIVGLAACYVPAHRASKVDPMVALRYE
jgi:putative ABC transport system permease protein